MHTLRSILFIDPSGCRLTDEYGSDAGAKMEIMLGSSVKLEFDLRSRATEENAELEIYPASDLQAVEYYFALDTTSANSDSPKFLRTSGITLESDSEGKSIFSIELPDCAVSGIKEVLKGRECAVMRAEIGGINADTETVFAWQFDITLRSRVYLGNGSETAVSDPAYYTAVQVEAALCRKLYCEYSSDGELWHENCETGDIYCRLRHGENGLASEKQLIPYGPQGLQGIQGERGETGIAGTHIMVPVTVFGDEQFGCVAYLDSEHTIRDTFYHVRPVEKIYLTALSANGEYSGDAVLHIGSNRVVINVGETPELYEIILPEGVSGFLEITRDTTDEADTLNDGTDAITVSVIAIEVD